MTRLALAFFIALTATAAHSQTCAPHEKIKAELEKNHGEKTLLLLVQPNGSVLEIFANVDKRTWSVLNVRPQGWSCIIGAGTGYIPVKQESSDEY